MQQLAHFRKIQLVESLTGVLANKPKVILKFIVKAFSPFGRIVDSQDLIVREQHLSDEILVANIFDRIRFDLLQGWLRKLGVLQRRFAVRHVHLPGARLFCVATDQVELNNHSNHRAECGNGGNHLRDISPSLVPRWRVFVHVHAEVQDAHQTLELAREAISRVCVSVVQPLKSLRFSSVGFDLCTRLVCLHQGAGLCVWTVQVLGMCPDFKFAGIETFADEAAYKRHRCRHYLSAVPHVVELVAPPFSARVCHQWLSLRRCRAFLSALGPRPTCSAYLGQLVRRLRQRHVLQCVHAHHVPDIVSRTRVVVKVR